MKAIYDLTPFTMLDYPDHTACIIWFAGCNFRCPYCHNPEMITGKGTMDINEAISFLKTRTGKLDAVVLSGGEATSYPELASFAKQVKNMGFKVKLDTNGSRPEVLNFMMQENLLDYIALDYKAPPNKFKKICGFKRPALFEESLDIICKTTQIPVEIRTTVHTDLLDENDIKTMINKLDSLNYKNTYYIQNYRETETLDSELKEQIKTLDITKIPKPDNFNILFRNF